MTRIIPALLCCFATACSNPPTEQTPDMSVSDATTSDTGPERERDTARTADAGTDAGPDAENDQGPSYVPPPVPAAPDTTATNESRARGFRLYYAERMSRLLTAHNRFQVTGGVTFGTAMGRGYVARTGDDFEVVGGPKDNNPIGTTLWNVYSAYRVFGTRELELTLIRLLNGLAFFEAVPGHGGMTSRQVYPGWTRTVDGDAGTVQLTRDGQPVAPPTSYNPELEAEMINTFWAGSQFIYRENPEDFIFNLMPGIRPGRYSVTHSFVELPKLIRHTDCCSSLMRTPDDKDWAGAFWGNHNSRDNFPDLGLGFLAARLAAGDTSVSDAVRGAAAGAVSAGERIGQSVLDNDTGILTVSDVGSYDSLEVSGTIRPHGEAENQDLGSLGACPMAYVAQGMTGALSTGQPLPLPGSTDKEFFSAPAIQNIVDCPIEDVPTCESLDDGYCSRRWADFPSVRFQNQPILQYFETNPALAPLVLGSWQNDFDDVTEAATTVYHFARLQGDQALIDEARATVFYLTDLQIRLAALAFPDDERRRDKQRYRAALYRAQVQLPLDAALFKDFAVAEADALKMERFLQFAQTSDVLLTDAEIADLVDEEIADVGRRVVEDRYAAAYPAEPPVRRTTTAYEARGFPEATWPWREVEVPRHQQIQIPHFLDEVVLCEHAPQWISCEWAKLGCAGPDLDESRLVDAADVALFNQAFAAAAVTCDAANSWCDGADLDRSGAADAGDEAFMTAADGCWY